LRILQYLKKGGLRLMVNSGQKGFTFIEVIMVISILGTLMAITAMSTQQYMGDHGKQAALAVEKQLIASAATAHLKNGGGLPVTDNDLYREKYIISKSVLADYVIDTEGNIIQTPK
jgi:prepilin-type N-terminal cleavage/methylation domain-containing protein